MRLCMDKTYTAANTPSLSVPGFTPLAVQKSDVERLGTRLANTYTVGTEIDFLNTGEVCLRVPEPAKVKSLTVALMG